MLSCDFWNGVSFMKAVVIENLSYTYPNSSKPSLRNVSLEIERGELVFIGGRSGCGKTTLARCICGLIPHVFGGEFSGRVVVADKDTVKHPVYALARSVGLVFQNPDTQFCTLEVEDEVIFGPENLGLPKWDIQKRLDWALNCVGLSQYINKPLQSLSYGQKQRVAIASVIAMSPEVLVLDEPFANVDCIAAKSIMETLIGLKEKQGKTIILIEHRIISEAIKHLDRIVLMEDGRVCCNLTSFHEVNSQYLTDYLQDVRFDIYSFSGNLNKSTNSIPQKPRLMELRNVTYQYDSSFLLEINVLPIFEGELLAVLGRNGSGKTTLAKIIAGFLKPDKGRILKLKDDLRIGFVFQNPEVQLFHSTVWDEVSFGFKWFQHSAVMVNESTKVELEKAGLLSKKQTHPQALSQGEKQRLALSAILSTKPELLILDEPTTGQDKYNLERLAKRLIDFKSNGGSIILITQDCEFIRRFADRIIILENGKLTRDAPNL